MDKVKQEIEKILSKFQCDTDDAISDLGIDYNKQQILLKGLLSQATSSLTALIIKWLESKKVKIIEDCWENVERDKTRNQLITELIGEVR